MCRAFLSGHRRRAAAIGAAAASSAAGDDEGARARDGIVASVA